MTWSELADRCELFVEERRQMIIALLKEAEIEMTRKVNIIENDVASEKEKFDLHSKIILDELKNYQNLTL